MTTHSLLLWAPLVVPVVVALLALLLRRVRWLRLAEPLVALVVLAAGVGLVILVRRDGPVLAAQGFLRVDALSAYMLAVVGAVGLVATWGGLRMRTTNPADGQFTALVALFLGSMSLALVSDNLGIMWVAIEATTITTAFLVGHHGTRAAVEAAWKYVVLGSVGVAIAFLGIVLLYGAGAAAGADPTLSWVALTQHPPVVDPALAKVALALAVLGFATKAGLAPMHSWLPDAHSQAPAPVSALMSGVLLSVAFYAILRVQAISQALIGSGFVRWMLIVGGLLSLLVAALLLLTQRDYKRMLAYSSIEHMGLIALGAGIGGTLALVAVLLHILGHGLVKSSMFVSAGRILGTYGSSRIGKVRGLLADHPRIGVPFLIGLVALMGFPPFGLFFTEVALVIAGWQRGFGWAAALALVFIVLAFTGLARAGSEMALSNEPPDSTSDEDEAEGHSLADTDPHLTAVGEDQPSKGPLLPLALALATTAVLGFAAWPLADVLRDAVACVGGLS